MLIKYEYQLNYGNDANRKFRFDIQQNISTRPGKA